MCNHNKAQQSKIRVHISWDILYLEFHPYEIQNNSIYPHIRPWLKQVSEEDWKKSLTEDYFMSLNYQFME